MRDALDPGPVPTEVESSDIEALERLVGRSRNVRLRVCGLARLLGRRVEKALRAEDRKTLARVYPTLTACELPISARLARTLRIPVKAWAEFVPLHIRPRLPRRALLSARLDEPVRDGEETHPLDLPGPALPRDFEHQLS